MCNQDYGRGHNELSENYMIKKILTYFAAQMDEYLRRKFPQPEGVVEVGFMGNGANEKPCKLILSLVNVERETAGGISATSQRDGSEYKRGNPPILLNLNLILAAVYDERRYTESLSVLSEALTFIQSHPAFNVDGRAYTVEIVALSAQDINNIWTTQGGQYYPSVMCRLRRLMIDAEETASSSIAGKPDVRVTK